MYPSLRSSVAVILALLGGATLLTTAACGGGGGGATVGPTVTDVSPGQGLEAGGTAITITGTSFLAGATVSVGGNPAAGVVVVDSTMITCSTPAGTGIVDVAVTTAGGTGTLAGSFTYAGLATIMVVDNGINAVVIWRPDDDVDGNEAPDSTIGGVVNTQFADALGLDHDSRTDTLVVGDTDNEAVKFFDGVTSLDGDVAPTRTLVGAATLLDHTYDVVVDEVRNVLYASYRTGAVGGVLAFANASTIDGNVAPVRNITGFGNHDKRIFVDAINDRLYVADSDSVPPSLKVYDNASTVTGDVAPDRTVSGASTNFVFPWGIAVDIGRDILYLSDESGHAIHIFDNASTIDGNIAPSRTVTGATSTLDSPSDIAVDPVTDTLYVTNYSMGVFPGSLSVWENASTVDGDVAPSRAIEGAATTLEGPKDVVVAR